MLVARALAAVLWDMDGTLIDTEGIWIQCQLEMALDFNARWTVDDGLAHVGRPMDVTARDLRAAGVTLPAETIGKRLTQALMASLHEAMPWRPGARRLVSQLQSEGVPQAIVTTSCREQANLLAAALPNGAIGAVISIEDVANPKPHPEPYLAAARAVGADPSECVAIEDSAVGIRSAIDAGVATIGVPNNTDIPGGARWTRFDSLSLVSPTDLELTVRRHLRRRRVERATPAGSGHPHHRGIA